MKDDSTAKEYTLAEFLQVLNNDYKGWAVDRPRTLESWAVSVGAFLALKEDA